jgi:phosphatidylserine/phosphatidylglycerophosphate/cardiolipin synthase-like enzyme
MITEPVAVIAQRYPLIVTPLIAAAKSNIDIIVYDWRWYPTVSGGAVSQFNAAIVAAAKRGVKVRALVTNDVVKNKLRSLGIDAKRLQSDRMLHTKMILIDDTELVIGSHNFTQRAFSLNEEASVLVSFGSADHEFKTYFEHLWAV